jgi:hypothetical protein
MPTYDWSELDTWLDVLVRSGNRLIFELMLFPKGWPLDKYGTYNEFFTTDRTLQWQESSQVCPQPLHRYRGTCTFSHTDLSLMGTIRTLRSRCPWPTNSFRWQCGQHSGCPSGRTVNQTAPF